MMRKYLKEYMARRIVQKRFCDQNHCSHYIDIVNVRFYRGKFLLSTLIILTLVVLLFGGITYSYYNSQRKVIESHQQFNKDLIRTSEKLCEKYDSLTVFHVQLKEMQDENEKNILSQMELQYEKIQSDFTILSLWAGVLMVVFLIFSIYSMFKTDEIQYQSREALKKIDDLSEKIKQRVEDINKEVENEKKKLEKKSEEALDQLKEQTDSKEESFTKLVDKKVADFTEQIEKVSNNYQQMYTSAINKMERLAQERKDAVSELISEIRESGMGSRQDKKSEEEGSTETKTQN